MSRKATITDLGQVYDLATPVEIHIEEIHQTGEFWACWYDVEADGRAATEAEAIAKAKAAAVVMMNRPDEELTARELRHKRALLELVRARETA